jgi:sec-independent protein translocase protein TatB
MLGVGWTEMLVIGVVALIVIGPKELPALMHRVGKFAGTIRRMGSDFQRELNKTTGLNEITNLRQSVTQPLKATADAIRKEFNTTTASGQVQPSGVLKPADPKVESVVDEIKAAAGIATPAAAAAPVMTPIAQPAEAPKAPVKAARPARIKAPAESKVATTDMAPVKAAPKAKKPIDSPAPVEAIAPTRATPAKQATVKAAKPVAKAESVAAKPAAKAAPAKAVKTAVAEPAAKPATKKPAAAAKKP